MRENLVLIDFIGTDGIHADSISETAKDSIISAGSLVLQICNNGLRSLPLQPPRQYKLPLMSAPPDTYPLLESINSPADLRRLPANRLTDLAQELRQFLIHSVSTRGGHFAAGLGTVELTIALHYVFNTPHDRLVWDVGHQAYPHKVLTGRRDRLHTIKQDQGLAPVSEPRESEYDTFGVGHSSTSISAALGHGRRGGATRRRAPGRGHHRRRRADRGHGLRSAQSCRFAADRSV